MRLHDLKPKAGARRRRKRIGRGRGSGHGKTSTRGTKGQHSRAGSSFRPGFEGGQMPLARRLPKRGFNNKRFRTMLLPVNLAGLEEHFDAGATVDEAMMRQAGLANGKSRGVKILGNGKLTKKLDVTATNFSEAAKSAIEAAGGTCTLVSSQKEVKPAVKKKASKEEPKAVEDSPSEAEAPESEVADEKPAEEQQPEEEAKSSDDKPSEEETG